MRIKRRRSRFAFVGLQMVLLGTYHEAVGEEKRAVGVGEAEEPPLRGRRRGVAELPIGERREVVRHEAGPDGVGVCRGSQVPGYHGGAAGVPRRGEGKRRREELLRQARDLAGARRFHRFHRENWGLLRRNRN
jgi:hypothetical protein